jgi:integrase
MPVIKLTQDLIDSGELQCPPSKLRHELCDSAMPGLYLLISSRSDVKSFYLRFRSPKNGGRTTHVKLGRTTEISLDEARERAKKLKAEITLGMDPKAAEKTERTAITLDKAVQDYVWPYLRPRLRTAQKYEDMYQLRISRLYGSTPITDIRREQLLSLHTALVRDEGLSHATANRYLAMVRRIFSLLVQMELLTISPANRIPMYPESGAEQFLQADSLQKLLAALQNGTKRNFMVRMLALFLLSTGARLNEALRAKWKDIDRENRVWRIPASNSKSKKVRSVPLNDSAIEVLDQLGTEDKFEWLFVNAAKGERLKYVHGVWERLRDKAGMPNLRLHDLRHSHASMLINQGHTLFVVQKILGHNDPSVTQRYAHLSTRSLQEASDSASEMIQKAMKKSA